ncbi:MAG: DNA mismatch repair protein MutS [Bacillota bacterium]
MTNVSILFPGKNKTEYSEKIEPPDFFIDLNLDQVVDAITSPKPEYNLKPIFYSPLMDIHAIMFRQEIFRDLEDDNILGCLKQFAQKMILAHRYFVLSGKLYYKYHKEGWLLEAAYEYCCAVIDLSNQLNKLTFSSQGLRGIKQYLAKYTVNPLFLTLFTTIKNIKAELEKIQYSVIIKGRYVYVRKYENEVDYSIEVKHTFEKFRQGKTSDYRVDLVIPSGMNHIEAQILDFVSKLNPDVFNKLDYFYLENTSFFDNTIIAFDREIQFFISYIDFMEKIRTKGLKFCFPAIISSDKKIHANNSYDLALANKYLYQGTEVVTNDFYLEGKERIIVVSGPNQGGKTTFARMFGQIHYLASLGCPIPGTDAQVFLYDNIFTHFEKEEDIRNLRGKLQDDLIRVHTIINMATSRSIVIMNEIFTSTALKDAIFLSKEIINKIIKLDALCVCVSFIDELSIMSEQTVSMVSSIVAENPNLRSFKILRKPADGLLHAIRIAEKHGLTYDAILGRIQE